MDSGLAPAEGGVEQGGGEEEREGVVDCRECIGEGDEGRAEEESEACFGGEDDARGGVEGMCAAVGVGTEAL